MTSLSNTKNKGTSLNLSSVGALAALLSSGRHAGKLQKMLADVAISAFVQAHEYCEKGSEGWRRTTDVAQEVAAQEVAAQGKGKNFARIKSKSVAQDKIREYVGDFCSGGHAAGVASSEKSAEREEVRRMLTTGTCDFAGKTILDFFKFCGYLRPRGGVPVAEATTKLVTFLTNQSLPRLLDRDRIAELLDLGIMDVAQDELGRMGEEDGASLRGKIVEAVCGPETGLLRASARAASRLGHVDPRTRTDIAALWKLEAQGEAFVAKEVDRILRCAQELGEASSENVFECSEELLQILDALHHAFPRSLGYAAVRDIVAEWSYNILWEALEKILSPDRDKFLRNKILLKNASGKDLPDENLPKTFPIYFEEVVRKVEAAWWSRNEREESFQLLRFQAFAIGIVALREMKEERMLRFRRADQASSDHEFSGVRQMEMGPQALELVKMMTGEELESRTVREGRLRLDDSASEASCDEDDDDDDDGQLYPEHPDDLSEVMQHERLREIFLRAWNLWNSTVESGSWASWVIPGTHEASEEEEEEEAEDVAVDTKRRRILEERSMLLRGIEQRRAHEAEQRKKAEEERERHRERRRLEHEEMQKKLREMQKRKVARRSRELERLANPHLFKPAQLADVGEEWLAEAESVFGKTGKLAAESWTERHWDFWERLLREIQQQNPRGKLKGQKRRGIHDNARQGGSLTVGPWAHIRKNVQMRWSNCTRFMTECPIATRCLARCRPSGAGLVIVINFSKPTAMHTDGVNASWSYISSVGSFKYGDGTDTATAVDAPENGDVWLHESEKESMARTDHGPKGALNVQRSVPENKLLQDRWASKGFGVGKFVRGSIIRFKRRWHRFDAKVPHESDRTVDCAEGRDRLVGIWFDHGKSKRAVNTMSDLNSEAGVRCRRLLEGCGWIAEEEEVVGGGGEEDLGMEDEEESD